MDMCVKCYMDPCLCHIDGFGSEDPDEGDTTNNKSIEEIMGKRCIVNVTPEGEALFTRTIKNYNSNMRASGITGIIKDLKVMFLPEPESELLELDLENPTGPSVIPTAILKVVYEESQNGYPYAWYLDDEVMYL